jgi:hypothetical protein
MSEINRYRPTVAEIKVTAYCGAHPDGEYVSFADYDAAIAALEAKCSDGWDHLHETTLQLKAAREQITALASDCAAAERGHDAAHEACVEYEVRIAALEADCNIMCNALQRIEAGEPEPRMIARRTLEHWSEKATLSIGKTEGD